MMNICKRTSLFVVLIIMYLAMGEQGWAQDHFDPWDWCGNDHLEELTNWVICWQTHDRNGLVILFAGYRESRTTPWLLVLGDTRVSEIFVPYHGNEARYYDVTGSYSQQMMTLTTRDCPASEGAVLLGGGAGTDPFTGLPWSIPPKVCGQSRDCGLSARDDSGPERCHEVLLWGILKAANYKYIIEWTFRDDGVVLGRVGATGQNNPVWPYVAHMHNVTWRLDLDLDGTGGDSAYLFTHTETGLMAEDSETLIPNEAGIAWDPLNFSELAIHDQNLISSPLAPSNLSYHLIPLRYGTARHQEEFTRNDFWVTKKKWAGEMFAGELPTYASPPESVSNTDIVVWYTGSIHHMPRLEDGQFSCVEDLDNEGAQICFWVGVTRVMWVGFMLKPQNILGRQRIP